ncbi:MAG: Rieske (2Fe-2S) protein [Tepidisphaeraceae bacterium]
MAQTTRRHFLVVSASAAGCSLLVLSNLAAAAPKPTGPDAIVDAGPISDYAADGLFDKFVNDKRFFVRRNAGKLYAISATCTHKEVLLRKRADKGDIFCKGHGSTFDLDGTTLGGKAKVSLPRHKIEIKDGHLIVDRSVEFYEKDWEKEGASVALPS